jgi:hypothetical protein
VLEKEKTTSSNKLAVVPSAIYVEKQKPTFKKCKDFKAYKTKHILKTAKKQLIIWHYTKLIVPNQTKKASLHFYENLKIKIITLNKIKKNT